MKIFVLLSALSIASSLNVNGNLHVDSDQTITGSLDLGGLRDVEAVIKNLQDRIEVLGFGCNFNNHFIKENDHDCYECPGGSKNAAFVTSVGANTACACAVNEFVLNRNCMACTGGGTNEAGDDPEGDDTNCFFNTI